MGRIRMYIHLDNQTDVTLTRTSEWADWTPGCFPPDTIGPGQQVMFQGEGKLFVVAVSGTEGRVTYSLPIAGGKTGELYIHFKSPAIEDQYGNTFHIWAPPGFEVTWTGGQGHTAHLNVRLRRTARRAVPNFNPAVHGFAFSNKWSHALPAVTVGLLWNRLLDALPGPLAEVLKIARADENWLPITKAGAGMCGGMVYAVMDYFHQHQLPPSRSTPPTTADDPLFEHIRARLWDSFDVGGDGHRHLGYASPHYPNGDEGVSQQAGLMKGRSWVTYREEWPKIQADIDAGRLSPISLVHSDELAIGEGHQVLGHAYEKSGQRVTLYIYDPNHPGKSTALAFEMSDTAGAVHMTRTAEDESPESARIFCMFRTNGYVAKQAPQGRRHRSMRAGLLAAATMRPPVLSVRRAVAPGPNGVISVTNWLRSL